MGLTLILSWLSDRLYHRYNFLVFCVLIANIGYGMLLNVEHLSRGARYAACYLIAGGGICSGPIAIVFLSKNLANHWKRAKGSACQGGARLSHWLRGGVSHGVIVWLAATIMAVGICLENRKRDRGDRDKRLGVARGTSEESGR
ncbi:hypothetical protein N7495_002596 [Penicillium taxi]|uniref:uncharacterized protein n=1 Tax=Penicillium taxi TaxID=168475 RepID=UPI0025456E1D|nr:uncharacterized protein N7495_002596 [Penicillium taxi]KAJ5902068.1 hypothetical protein N7495_002596 [Penicillium taxi]